MGRAVGAQVRTSLSVNGRMNGPSSLSMASITVGKSRTEPVPPVKMYSCHCGSRHSSRPAGWTDGARERRRRPARSPRQSIGGRYRRSVPAFGAVPLAEAGTRRPVQELFAARRYNRGRVLLAFWVSKRGTQGGSSC
ncbi:hypothetical protein SVIO_107370 [Streptomyces violaceusniger]|uniref:Uncharacterized protein n=1 Tax=Streptomyces violaceusniger TaxID=68280 RepID=A0A4D4LI30_STRVO|nr:hypothetical protein SVIO_107370 [Streptomyces violaceusniger]